MFTGHHVSIKLHWTGLAWPGLVWAGLDWISLDNYIKIYTGSSPARVPSNVTMLSLLLELASGDVTRGHQAKCKSHWPTLNVLCPVSYLHDYFSSFSKCFPPAPFHMETLKHIQHVSPTSASSQCQLPVLTPSRVKWSTRHHQLQCEQHNRSVLLLLHCSYVFSPSLINPEGLEGLSVAWRHASHSHQGMINIVDIPGMF